MHLSKHALAKLYIASCSEPFATAKWLSLQEGASCSVVQQIKRLHDATVEISEAASSPSRSATPPSQHFHRNVPPSRNRYIGGRTLNYMIQRSKHASKPACLPQLPALLKRPSGCVKGNPFKLGAPRPIPWAIVVAMWWNFVPFAAEARTGRTANTKDFTANAETHEGDCGTHCRTTRQSHFRLSTPHMATHVLSSVPSCTQRRLGHQSLVRKVSGFKTGNCC